MPPALVLAAEGTLNTLLCLGTNRLTSDSDSANSSTRPRISIFAMRCRVGHRMPCRACVGYRVRRAAYHGRAGCHSLRDPPQRIAPRFEVLRKHLLVWLVALRRAYCEKVALRVQKVDRIDQKTSDDPYEEYGHGGHVAADMDISTGGLCVR